MPYCKFCRAQEHIILSESVLLWTTATIIKTIKALTGDLILGQYFTRETIIVTSWLLVRTPEFVKKWVYSK